jgi:hypothetical protein
MENAFGEKEKANPFVGRTCQPILARSMRSTRPALTLSLSLSLPTRPRRLCGPPASLHPLFASPPVREFSPKSALPRTRMSSPQGIPLPSCPSGHLGMSPSAVAPAAACMLWSYPVVSCTAAPACRRCRCPLHHHDAGTSGCTSST